MIKDRPLLSLRSAVIVGSAGVVGYATGSVMALLAAAAILHMLIELG